MNIEEKFSRKPDLENNFSLTIWNNWCLQQNVNALYTYYDFIKNIKPKRIVEIGSAHGGLTLFLNECVKDLNLDTKIRGYENNHHDFTQFITEKVDIFVGDCFDSIFQDEMKSFIQQEGTTMVLCDGGNKIKEFNYFSGYLKTGDFIFAHDYCRNKEYFEEHINKKIWNWCEITLNDIKPGIESNNLEEYDADTFQKAAWACFRKK